MSSSNHFPFLAQGGPLGALMRQKDWTGTPLGSPESWPQSLRTTVGLILHARHPIIVFWGPQHICLYNESYSRTVGAQSHPQALGRPAEQGCAAVWRAMGPDVKSVMRGKEPTLSAPQRMTGMRGDDQLTTWWTFGYSPIDHAASDHSVGGVLVICNDMTIQRSISDSLVAGNDHVRELFRQSPNYICVLYGPDHILALVNDACLSVVGYRELIGKPVREAMPELGGHGIFELLDAVYASGTRHFGRAVPFKVQKHPGAPLDVRYADFIYQPIRQADGSVIGIFVEGTDVTEHKNAVTQLNEALEMNRAVFRYSLDVICTIDGEGKFTQVSDSCSDMWGYEPAELVGTPYLDLVHPEDQQMTVVAATSVMAGVATSSFANRYVCKNGDIAHMLWSAIWVPGQEKIFAVARNISARVKAEEKMREMAKMESIGHIAGGIAHDFNNLLTVILGNADLLIERLALYPQLLAYAEMVRMAGQTGADLTSRLLAFARKRLLLPIVVAPGEVISGMRELLCGAVGQGITVEIINLAGPVTTSIDLAQFESSILNLCLNARDAMQGQGTLTIETSKVSLDSLYVSEHGEIAPGEYLMVAISDTGCGMHPDILKRAIDPFFTTKEASKGTGLGLSMVYGFVKQSGGHLALYSEVGHGTVVKIYLPALNAGVRSVLPENKSDQMVGGDETVLLVEDDKMVRMHAASLLEGLGYHVIVADNGTEALAALRNDPHIDLLFTDVIMPGGMTGPQLAVEANLLRPDLPVLYTSGYAEYAIVHHGRLGAGLHLLHKPYRASKLAEKVRQALADKPNEGASQLLHGG